jgi:argininosuccinate lyase
VERAERAASGLLLATDVADYLVSRGVSFRARARSRRPPWCGGCSPRRRDFSDLTMAEWREASEMFGERRPRAATALASVQARRTPQSTNPTAVQAALRECLEWIAAANAKAQIPSSKSPIERGPQGLGIWYLGFRIFW